MIALDTETTGIDLRHGAKPFFVSTCDDDGKLIFFEWDVDPETREPLIPADDIDHLNALIAGESAEPRSDGANFLVLQNPKFDAAALHNVGVTDWPWHRTYDTLLAGHLLASNQPHDLTSMTLHYLGVDIQPYEVRLEAAVKEARRVVQQDQLRVRRGKEPGPYANWRIANKDDPCMPSCKDQTWRFDYWVPRALVRHWWNESAAGRAYRGLMNDPAGPGGFTNPALAWNAARRDASRLPGWEYHPPLVSMVDSHPWWTVLSDYAVVDAEVLLPLWSVMKSLMEQRSLWRIYEERLKVLPIAFRMESNGVTVSKERLDALKDQYGRESAAAADKCVGIAAAVGYELSMPRSSNNASLLKFCFGEDLFDADGQPTGRRPWLNLPTVKRSKETGKPSLDKYVLEHYEGTLPDGPALEFVKTLRGKRGRDTAITYLEGYERYWLPTGLFNDDGEQLWFRLYPSINPTGTDTLRWSSSNPNEQNISKREGGGMTSLRFCFGPAPDREWWSCDAKNIEARLPAYESGERELITLYEEPDKPPYYGSSHLLNFHTVYADLWEAGLKEVGFDKVGPYVKKKYASTWYQWCKNGGFAVQYGAVDKSDGTGTADRAFHRPGAHALLKARFARLEALNQRWIRFAAKHGYVETMPDRTVDPERGYPVMCTRTEFGKILPTVPLNYHIQSTAMWWTMTAMIRCDAQLAEWRKSGFDGYMNIQCHDELVFDFPRRPHPLKDPKRSNLGRMKLLARLMAQGGANLIPSIPTPVGIEYHDVSWAKGDTLA